MANEPNRDTGTEQDWGADLLDVRFKDNPEPRCPVVLLLDTSGSMEGDPIAQLNEGIVAFRDDVLRDDVARKRVEVAIVTFGGEVRVFQDFVTVDEFAPPILRAEGSTPMGAAILRSLDLLGVRKSAYKANGIDYYRPWLFLITDGAPQGEPPSLVQQAADNLIRAQEARHVVFFAVGVEGADIEMLRRLSPTRPPLKLKGLRFRDLFLWLSKSMMKVSHSRPEEEIPLPPVDWGTV